MYMRTVHRAVMPMSGGTIKVSTRKHIKGGGYGSVLLDGGLGGYGGASSYTSVDDYINTTGLNPLAGQPRGKGLGVGMKEKIQALMPKSKAIKPKNINFNL